MRPLNEVLEIITKAKSLTKGAQPLLLLSLFYQLRELLDALVRYKMKFCIVSNRK